MSDLFRHRQNSYFIAFVLMNFIETFFLCSAACKKACQYSVEIMFSHWLGGN